MMQKQFTRRSSWLIAVFIVLILLASPSLADQDRKHINAARKAISKMEYSTAATELNAHLKLYPDDTRVLHLLAKTYSWDNQFDAAINTYDQLLTIEPDKTEYLFGKAQSLIWLEKYLQAIPLLEKAWQQQPDNIDILRNLILSLNQSNKAKHKQRAKELGQIARKQFPNVPWEHIIE